MTDELRMFCAYNSMTERQMRSLLDKNGITEKDLLLIDTIQYPTTNSQFDSPYFNARTFCTQVNRVIKNSENIYLPKYMVLFHGAGRSTEKDILDKGLLPTSSKRRRSYQSQNGYVYLASDFNKAFDFGMLGNGGNISVFAVLVKTTELCIDTDQLNNKRAVSTESNLGYSLDIKNTLADSLWFGRSVRVRGKIEPYRLELLKL